MNFVLVRVAASVWQGERGGVTALSDKMQPLPQLKQLFLFVPLLLFAVWQLPLPPPTTLKTR
jgi:hypothetical protein